MSTKTTLKTSTSLAAPTAVPANPAARIIAAVSTQAIKSDAARRASDAALARGLLAWLAQQPDTAREDIFVAIEATLSPSECRKLATHPLRPQIDPARIDAAREDLALAEEQARAEKQRAVEGAKRQREEARRARQDEKDAAERARYEALRAKFEAPAAAANDVFGAD